MEAKKSFSVEDALYARVRFLKLFNDFLDLQVKNTLFEDAVEFSETIKSLSKTIVVISKSFDNELKLQTEKLFDPNFLLTFNMQIPLKNQKVYSSSELLFSNVETFFQKIASLHSFLSGHPQELNFYSMFSQFISFSDGYQNFLLRSFALNLLIHINNSQNCHVFEDIFVNQIMNTISKDSKFKPFDQEELYKQYLIDVKIALFDVLTKIPFPAEKRREYLINCLQILSHMARMGRHLDLKFFQERKNVFSCNSVFLFHKIDSMILELGFQNELYSTHEMLPLFHILSEDYRIMALTTFSQLQNRKESFGDLWNLSMESKYNEKFSQYDLDLLKNYIFFIFKSHQMNLFVSLFLNLFCRKIKMSKSQEAFLDDSNFINDIKSESQLKIQFNDQQKQTFGKRFQKILAFRVVSKIDVETIENLLSNSSNLKKETVLEKIKLVNTETIALSKRFLSIPTIEENEKTLIEQASKEIIMSCLAVHKILNVSMNGQLDLSLIFSKGNIHIRNQA